MDVDIVSNGLTQPFRVVLNRVNGIGSDQLVIQFGNGYGASIVRGPYTYGGREGFYEVAVIKFRGEGDDWDLCYETPITDDVLGWQSEEQVVELARRIADLPSHLAVTP